MSNERLERALKRATDTKACVIGEDVLPQVVPLFREWFPGSSRAMVVCDPRTRAAAGERNEELLREVWQYEFLGDLRAVDVAVRRLREKIENDAANPEHVMTKRGVGYYFKAENVEKATHGYPTDYPGYGVFFAVSEPQPALETNSILEVSKAAQKFLGL